MATESDDDDDDDEAANLDINNWVTHFSNSYHGESPETSENQSKRPSVGAPFVLTRRSSH